MTYEAWRISYQSSEQAARAAYAECEQLRTKITEMEQPAPSVPREAIEKMLTQLMDIAVSNGANSISMPDEYVEVAAWLCGIPAQPAPTIPESVMEVIAGLIYEVERNICPHEETHRGGQWEICDMCGARWADDMGGKPEFKWPEVVEKARDMLEAATEAKP